MTFLKNNKLAIAFLFFSTIFCFNGGVNAQIVFENVECNNSGSLGVITDDYVVFAMNPTPPVFFVELPYTYSVSASISGIPISVYTLEGLSAISITYGRKRSFKLAAGSCGKGDIVITVSPDWGVYSSLVDTITSPSICTHYTCDASSGSKSIKYSYNSAFKITNVSSLPTYIPRFDTSGAKVLDSVKIKYKASVVTSLLFENNSSSTSEIAFRSEAKLDFKLNGSSISNPTIYPFISPGYPAYGLSAAGSIVVPASGSWLGDVLGSFGVYSTLERMGSSPTPPWLSTTMYAGMNPLVDPRWVTNATSDTSTDNDFLLDILYQSDSFSNNHVYGSSSIEKNNFIGLGLIPFDYSADVSNSLISSGGTSVSSQFTQTVFNVEVEYFFTLPCYTISGNIFNDPNGGNVNNSTGIPNNISTGIFAYLIDEDSLIVSIDTVFADGVFAFDGQQPGTYRVVISKDARSLCAFAPSSLLPIGWLHTGEYNGLPNTGRDGILPGVSEAFTLTNTNIDNINFGIQQPPSTQTRYYSILPPFVDEMKVLNGVTSLEPLAGNDPTDGVLGARSSFVISSLPLDGELWYKGVKIATPNFVITDYNPDSLSFKFTGSGYSFVEFYYASIDSAGAIDPIPVQYAIEWLTALPINFIDYKISSNQCAILLNWKISQSSRQEVNRFEIQSSTDGKNFTSLEENLPNTIEQFEDKNTKSNFYRVVAISVSGKRMYTATLKANRPFCNEKAVFTYPNPAQRQLNIIVQGTSEYNSYEMLDALGRIVLNGELSANDKNQIDVSQVLPGLYILKTIVGGQINTQQVQIVK